MRREEEYWAPRRVKVVISGRDAGQIALQQEADDPEDERHVQEVEHPDAIRQTMPPLGDRRHRRFRRRRSHESRSVPTGAQSSGRCFRALRSCPVKTIESRDLLIYIKQGSLFGASPRLALRPISTFLFLRTPSILRTDDGGMRTDLV